MWCESVTESVSEWYETVMWWLFVYYYINIIINLDIIYFLNKA